MERKDYLHNPPHLFLDEMPYFITAATYQRQALLKEPELKKYLLNCIQSYFKKYQWELHHWVILDDHYHLLGKSQQGCDLTKIMQQIHSISGYHIKQIMQIKTPVWWNYWDYCPRSEKDYLTCLNYLFNNPVKHHYVNNLMDYPFSSFHIMLEQQGRETLVNQFKAYPNYNDLYFEAID
jgi:putative transposase